MITMKNRTIVVLSVAAVIATVMLVGIWRENSVKHWDEVACKTFRKALNEDLQNRRDLKVEYNEGKKQLSVEEKLPASVFVTSKHGRREYKVDSCRHVNNVAFDSRMRVVHSMALEKVPLACDTIEAIWRHRLSEQAIVASTVIRVSVTDLENHTTSEYSKTAVPEALPDSLLSCYVGYRCEVEATGFIDYEWLGNVKPVDFFVFTTPLLLLAVLCAIGHFWGDRIEDRFTRKVPVIVEKEVPVIVEKEILVVTTEKGREYGYKLPDGTLFDFDNSLLKNGERSVHLTNQERILLKAFVEAENNRLTVDEVISLFWSKTNAVRGLVYRAISRLRSALEKVSNLTLVNKGCAYQLKMSRPTEG